MSARERLLRLAALTAEALGSLLLVLASFWLFMALLSFLLPAGTPLKELVEIRSEPERRPREGEAEATLSALVRDVRLRRSNSIAWGNAREGIPLYNEDAVQTLDRSGARISFDRDNHLVMGSNSLVVVSRTQGGNDQERRRSYRVRLEGEIRGNLASRRMQLEFSTAGHLARVGREGAQFRISRNGDSSYTLTVWAGEAELLGRGERLLVPAQHAVTLQQGVVPTEIYPLLRAPRLERAHSMYRFRLLPPRVRFSWSGGKGNYRFQLAEGVQFRHLLLDEKLTAPEFVTGKLERGVYFWRVCRVEQGREGPFSAVGRCELKQSVDPPPLAVTFPEARVAAGSYTVTGVTGPGGRVLVNGTPVAVDREGRFSCPVTLNPGVNLIRVEALDALGNASYASRIVYANVPPDP